MDTTLLVDEQIDAGARFLQQLQQNGIAVDSAVWALASEDNKWALYIASPLVDASGIGQAYAQVNRELNHSPLSRSQIKLISSSHPIATEAAKYRSMMSSSHLGPWFGGRRLGNLIVEDAYIYPLAN